MKSFCILVLFCANCAAQATREHPCPPGQHMEGNFDRVYACVADSKSPVVAPTTLPAKGESSEASWEPKFGFDNELFPSLILSTSGRAHKPPSDSRSFGDELGIAGVVVRPSTPNSKVHVEIQIEGFTDLSTIDVTLPDP